MQAIDVYKLWLLRPRNEDDPIWADYDVNRGCVVRAATEKEARDFATTVAGDEGKDYWKNGRLTDCRPLTCWGPKGVIICDTHHG